LGVDEDTLLLGSVGRLAPEKNQEFMIDILSELRSMGVGCKLVIAGSGNHKAVLNKRSQDLGVEDYFKLLGNRSDTPELYSALDVFLLTSNFEGVPLSAVEAQSCGLPCFISDVVTRDVEVGNAKYLSLTGGPKKWAEAIAIACESGGVRLHPGKALSNAGFDVSTEASKLMAYYTELMRCAIGKV